MKPVRTVLRLWIEGQASSLGWWRTWSVRRWQGLRRTRRLRGSRRDRRAFLFAAGSSMRNLDPVKIAHLQRTAGFDVIGLNAYVTTDFGRVAPPDVYLLSDPASWSRAVSDAEVQHLDAAGKAEFRARFGESVRSTWEQLRSRNPVLFVPAEHHPVPDYPNAYPFCAAANLFASNVTDVTRPLAIRPYTAYRALALACFLGYREIYVCGIDNDTFKTIVVDQDNIHWSRYEHFYDDPSAVQLMPSRDLFLSLYYTALAFGCLEAFCGQPIVNLDPAGLVDAFPKRHTLDVYRDGRGPCSA